MKKNLILSSVLALVGWVGSLQSHCQMPCGIYHDNMVYDQIDQYIETMVKGMTVMNDDKFDSLHDKNEFVRWIITKENESNKIAELITTYFLQQKIKPDDDGTAQKVLLAHKMLFDLVGIKQNIDVKMVKNFEEVWNKFKLLFHAEGYEQKVDQMKQKQLEEARQKAQQTQTGQSSKKADQTHSHHYHSHPHTHSHASVHTHE